MSTNSLLASLYSTNNISTTTRSSSLFTNKQYSFMSNLNINQHQNRPSSLNKSISSLSQSIHSSSISQSIQNSSISKSIENSSPNDLIKWTPLIKTVHKLSSKIKKHYFFFWCRMEAHIKNKYTIKNQQNKDKIKDKENKQNLHIKNTHTDKQNSYNKENIQPKLIYPYTLVQKLQPNALQSDKTQPNLVLQITHNKTPLQQNTSLLNHANNNQCMNSQNQYTKPKLQFNPKINQQPLKTQQMNFKKTQNALLYEQSEQQKLKKQKQTKLSNFFISLSKLHYKISSLFVINSFQVLKIYGNKHLACNKITQLQFHQLKKHNMSEVLKILKKNSHHIIKVQILFNSLQNLINKNIAYAINQFKIKHDQIPQKIIKLQQPQDKIEQKSKIMYQLKIQKISTQKVIAQCKIQQTPRFHVQETVVKIEKQQETNKPSMKEIQKQKQKQVQKTQKLPLKINPSKNVTQFWFTSNFKNVIVIKEDKLLEKNFNRESKFEKMKKLNRLYPEEPFLQLPDISEITLFDSVIKNNSTIFEKKLTQNKSINNSLVSSIKLYTPRQKQASLISTNNFSQQNTPLSPRFQQHTLDCKNSEQLFRKASSCANITVTKNNSSSNLKNPNTPGSGKKIIGLFSKKKSVELFSKDSQRSTHKNYQFKLQSANSAVLKKFDLFSQVNTEKQKEHHKSKLIQSSSKETQKNDANRKIEKQKQNQRPYENKSTSSLKYSEQKSSHDSSKKLYHQGSSSKVVEKFYDMSAKRVATGSKKQNSSTKKENLSRNLFQNSSSKKKLIRKQSSKENHLSEFNTLSSKVISYEQFMRHIPGQKSTSGRTPLKQVCEKEPIFQAIQMTEQDFSSKDLNQCYGSCSAQLIKGKNESNQQKSKKLRSKIEKMEVNTARKMKMQIENMISQRKKSSIGILKF